MQNSIYKQEKVMEKSVNLLTQSTVGKLTRVKRALTFTIMTPLLPHEQKDKRDIQIRKVKNKRCSRLRCMQQIKVAVMNNLKSLIMGKAKIRLSPNQTQKDPRNFCLRENSHNSGTFMHRVPEGVPAV